MDRHPARRLPQWITLLAMVVAQCACAGSVFGQNGSGKPKQQYDIVVSGYFEGTGHAHVKDDDTIQIQAQVTYDGGKTNLTLPKVEGSFRVVDGEVIGTFSGTYSVHGESIVLNGRIEPAGEEADARFTAIYLYAGEEVGRIVGNVRNSKKPKKG